MLNNSVVTINPVTVVLLLHTHNMELENCEKEMLV